MFKKHGKIVSVILSVALILSMCCLQAAAATDPGETWYVVGDASLCGQNWVTGAAENQMTFNSESGLSHSRLRYQAAQTVHGITVHRILRIT